MIPLFYIVAYLTVGFFYSVIGIRLIGMYGLTDESGKSGIHLYCMLGRKSIPLGIYILATLGWPVYLFVHLAIPCVLWFYRFLKIEI